MSRVIKPPDKLLDLIYDAATDEELWTPALTGIADLTDSIGSFMFGAEIKASLVTFTFKGRLSEEADRVYQERHVNNPLSDHMNASPVGKIVAPTILCPYEN